MREPHYEFHGTDLEDNGHPVTTGGVTTGKVPLRASGSAQKYQVI